METENKLEEVAESTTIEASEKVESRRFTGNVLFVLFSNGLTVLAGIVVNFVIPLVLGVSEHGYYRTFGLYASYIGIFHFGFIDGIYLYFAGKKYEDLDKKKFATYTRFLFALELIVLLVITCIAMCFIPNELAYILVFVALNTVAYNMSMYFEFITQITMRFRLLSIRSIIRSSLTVLSVLVLYILFKFFNTTVHFVTYVSIVVGINYLLMIWYAFTYKDISFGRGNKIKEEKDEILSFFKIGIPLLCANLIGQLIFVVDQQFVSIFFENDTYSIYSFAYSMINLVTVATTAISTVLYPTLRNMTEERVKSDYAKINSMLLIFVSMCLVSYYFLLPFVGHFLPAYKDSLLTLRIVLPGVLISSSISVIKYNCYKKFNQIIRYFVKSLIILGLAIVLDIIALKLYHTTEAISIVSIIALLIWYILIELYFITKYQAKWIKNFVYLLLVLALFYGSLCIPVVWGQLLGYSLGYIVLTTVFFRGIIVEFVRKIF